MTTRIAFLFPGQGSQTVGMGRSLAEAFPVAAETFAEADEALGFPLSKLIFEGPEEDLRLTENTQPAILTVSVAVARFWPSMAFIQALAAGHSLGEWSAHVAAGTISFVDAVRAVKARGRAMQLAVPAGQGAMAAVLALDAAQVADACKEAEAETGLTVAAANLNSPKPDSDFRRTGGCGEGFGAGQGKGRAARGAAAGQRSVPLRADAAGTGRSGPRARCDHLGRSAHSPLPPTLRGGW
jgi:malonyl CoA-acyl carrier protein transacylase